MKTTLQNNAELIGHYSMIPIKGKTVDMLRLPKKINFKKKAINAFSLLVRTEAGFKCEFHSRLREMGLKSPCVCNDVMQCCHKISRKKLPILFDRRNVLCGCSSSNTWAHWNETEWGILWRKMYPEDVEYLETAKNRVVHSKQWDYKIMLDEYIQKIKEKK
jgi:hypothetical protein